MAGKNVIPLLHISRTWTL